MQTVIGLFENADDAQKAAQQLMSEGFTRDNVDVSVNSENKAFSSDYSSGSSTGMSGSRNSTGMSGSGNSTGMSGDTTTGSSTGITSGYVPDTDYNASGMNDNTSPGGNMGTSSDTTHTGDEGSFGNKVSKFFKLHKRLVTLYRIAFHTKPVIIL